MRVLTLLAIPTVLAGCSIPFDFSITDTFVFSIGDINGDCTVDEEPPEGCTITTSGRADSGECVITAECRDLVLIATEDVNDEIETATNGNQNIRARVDAIELLATSLTFTGFTGELPAGTTATATAFTAGATAFELDQSDYADLLAGTGDPTFEGVTVFNESRDAGSPFIDELNTAIEDDETLLVTGRIVITIPDVGDFDGTEPGTTGTLGYTANIDGRGGIRLTSN